MHTCWLYNKSVALSVGLHYQTHLHLKRSSIRAVIQKYPATEVGVGWLLYHYDKTWQMCLGSGVPDLPHSIRLTQSERRAYSHTGRPIMDIIMVCPERGSDVWADLRDGCRAGLLLFRSSWISGTHSWLYWCGRLWGTLRFNALTAPKEFQWLNSDDLPQITDMSQRKMIKDNLIIPTSFTETFHKIRINH